MGCSYQFRCQDCDLAAEVSGGADRGFYAKTETVWGQKCSRLQDVLVGEDKSDSPYPANVQHFTDVEPTCAECDSREVTTWQAGHPCPKCGGKMTHAKGTVDFWD